MKLSLILLALAALVWCAAASADSLPYPDASAPSPMPALAPAQDSDCGGVISLPPGPVRLGTWAVGAYASGHYSPMLFFNTGKDARSCAGSSGLAVRRLTRQGWR